MDMNMDMHTPTESPSSMSMPMVFTTSFSGVPILFQALQPTTNGQLFAVWIGIFATAIFYRSLGCLKTRLEATYWSPRCHYEGGFLGKKGGYIQPFSIVRDGERAILAFVTATLGYVLMLVVMSFIVAYFFAVVTGLAVGELVFARLYVQVGGSNTHEQDHH